MSLKSLCCELFIVARTGCASSCTKNNKNLIFRQRQLYFAPRECRPFSALNVNHCKPLKNNHELCQRFFHQDKPDDNDNVEKAKTEQTIGDLGKFLQTYKAMLVLIFLTSIKTLKANWNGLVKWWCQNKDAYYDELLFPRSWIFHR